CTAPPRPGPAPGSPAGCHNTRPGPCTTGPGKRNPRPRVRNTAPWIRDTAPRKRNTRGALGVQGFQGCVDQDAGSGEEGAFVGLEGRLVQVALGAFARPDAQAGERAGDVL